MSNPNKRPYPTFRYWLTNDFDGSVNVDTATTLQTPRNIYGNDFDGSTDLNQVIQPQYGGTGTPYVNLTGPNTLQTYTLPQTGGKILTTTATSYTAGDLIIAATPDSLTTLNDVATGNVLLSGGVSAPPQWGKLDLTSAVAGILAIANGGTNSSTPLQNNRFMVSSNGAIVEAPALTDGQLYIGRTGTSPLASTITAGSGITVTNSAGNITISATDVDYEPQANGQLAIGSTGSQPVLSTLTPGAGVSITNGPGTITISTVRNYAFNNVKTPSNTTITNPGTGLVTARITPLDTPFTTIRNNQVALIRIVINAECHHDACYILMIDDVEVGSAASTGSRNFGMSVVPFDNDFSSTMHNISLLHVETVALAGNHTLSVHIRGGSGLYGTGYALNKTLGDTDAVASERAVSNVFIEVL